MFQEQQATGWRERRGEEEWQGLVWGGGVANYSIITLPKFPVLGGVQHPKSIVCVQVCMHKYTHIIIYMYLYTCVCICTYICIYEGFWGVLLSYLFI